MSEQFEADLSGGPQLRLHLWRFAAVDRPGEGAITGRGLPSVFGTLKTFIEGTPLVFRPERSPEFYNAHSAVEFTYPHKGMPFTQKGGMAKHVCLIFIDPADATANGLLDVPMTLPDVTIGYYATVSYAANGLVPWGVGALSRSFPCGTSNTAFFVEQPQVCSTTDGETVYNLWGLGIYSPNMPAFAALTPRAPVGLLSMGQVAPVEPLPAEPAADREASRQVRLGWQDAPPMPPDFPAPLQQVRRGQQCDPRLPGGPHVAGMLVVMADGSVRTFAWYASPWVFWAACTPRRKSGE